MMNVAVLIALALQNTGPSVLEPKSTAGGPRDAASIETLAMSVEERLREEGMSREGAALVGAEFGGEGPDAAQQMMVKRLEVAERAWQAERTRPTPDAAALIAAGRDVRAAYRALQDRIAASQERVIGRLSATDLRIYLEHPGSRATQVLLGIP